MPKRNEFTEVMLDIKNEIAQAHKQAAKTRPVPFGQERLSARDARVRYSQMSRGEIEKLSPEQRKQMIDLLGADTVINQLRGQRNGP